MDEIAMEFIGDGSRFMNGVPMRDLTRAEWAAFTHEQQAQVRSSGLYHDTDMSGHAQDAFNQVQRASDNEVTHE